mmetsp:Transcript_84041/g.160542  ORF Transcript_84041/g.160542 Transcript_84041/m.160542 type:complete len:389 (+) Transcript_84041:758-1924(+)
MALWTASQEADLRSAWAIAEHAEGASSLSFGPLLAACEQRGMLEGELRVLRRLARGGLRGPALYAEALRLAELPGAAGPLPGSIDFMGQLTPGDAHEKELRLLAHVLSTATAGDAESVCKAVEVFGCDVLVPAGQWLKVAGGPKSEILMHAICAAPTNNDDECKILEVGTYCGYSAVQLARARPGSKIITLEADPARVIIARCLIAFAGFKHNISVKTGHSQDLLPVLKSQSPFSMVFLDQRGAHYGIDLAVLEKRGLLNAGAIIVADNVLKPGAPAYLWRVLCSGLYSTTLFSMEEFAMPGTEDWMSVSRCLERREVDKEKDRPAMPEPATLRRLEWEADRMRARAQAQSPDRGVSFAEWSAFATSMRERLAAHGIGPAIPWTGRKL